MTGPLWVAVDQLTRPARDKIERDDGSNTWADIPSLLDQAHAALRSNGSENQGTQWGSDAARSPVDLELLTIYGLIDTYTRRSLHERHLTPRPGRGLPDHVRQLAAHVVTHQADQDWWWVYRFESWVRLLRQRLGLTAHVATVVHLRNSPCPACGARQYLLDADDTDDDAAHLVVPAIVVEFRSGLVHAAQCQACAAVWWRGADLYLLAAALGTAS